MEDKKEEVKSYLKENVNPIIEPMLQKIAEEKPWDVLVWIRTWANQKIDQRKIQPQTDSQSDEQSDRIMAKIQAIKQKGIKKISRQGISAECFGLFNKKSAYCPKKIQKSIQAQEKIKGLLSNTIVFQGLEGNDLTIIINALQQFETQQGQPIIKQGDEGDMLFVVSAGQFECTKIIQGQEKYMKTYLTGESFGELALMYNSLRAATIRCSKSGILYGLDRQTFINIVQQLAQNKSKYMKQFLSKVGVLSEMQPYERQQLCDALKTQQYKQGQYVVRQGDMGDRFYLIAQGKLVAEKQQGDTCKKVFQYEVGDYFGEIALIKNTVRQASIRTVTDCRLMSIDRDSFKRIIGPIEDILMRNMKKYKKYMDQ